MKQSMRMFCYVLLVFVIGLLLVLHVFNLYPLRTDKFSFFLVGCFFVLLILPVVTSVRLPGLVSVTPRRRVLGKRK